MILGTRRQPADTGLTAGEKKKKQQAYVARCFSRSLPKPNRSSNRSQPFSTQPFSACFCVSPSSTAARPLLLTLAGSSFLWPEEQQRCATMRSCGLRALAGLKEELFSTALERQLRESDLRVCSN
ncbi:hypothetical protein MRX96_002590 [Rhipicephalus microplus]